MSMSGKKLEDIEKNWDQTRVQLVIIGHLSGNLTGFGHFWSLPLFILVWLSVWISMQPASFKTKECNTVLDSREKISEIKENLIQP